MMRFWRALRLSRKKKELISQKVEVINEYEEIFLKLYELEQIRLMRCSGHRIDDHVC